MDYMDLQYVDVQLGFQKVGSWACKKRPNLVRLFQCSTKNTWTCWITDRGFIFSKSNIIACMYQHLHFFIETMRNSLSRINGVA